MKLYDNPASDFCAKVRIAIYEKGLSQIELVPTAGGDYLRSPEYLAINSLGKIPSLDADGLLIHESETINEYLEDKFPRPSLLPPSPEDRARVRSFTRFNDLYFEPAIRALWRPMFRGLNDSWKDPKVRAGGVGEIDNKTDLLERMLTSGAYAFGPSFTLADCALASTMIYGIYLMKSLQLTPLTQGRPKMAAWWELVSNRPSVARAFAEAEKVVIPHLTSLGLLK